MRWAAYSVVPKGHGRAAPTAVVLVARLVGYWVEVKAVLTAVQRAVPTAAKMVDRWVDYSVVLME